MDAELASFRGVCLVSAATSRPLLSAPNSFLECVGHMLCSYHAHEHTHSDNNNNNNKAVEDELRGGGACLCLQRWP